MYNRPTHRMYQFMHVRIYVRSYVVYMCVGMFACKYMCMAHTNVCLYILLLYKCDLYNHAPYVIYMCVYVYLFVCIYVCKYV